ncbi:MAG: methyltetrahydrofolate--corrinoid methyltransferase, partial [Deltaproteobacteria bacterium SG8_13]
SIGGESARFEKVLPLVKSYSAPVVALCLDDSGIPNDGETAVAVGDRLVSSLLEAGLPANKIYLDPLVRSVATSPESVLDTLELMKILGAKYEGLHFISGLSNVSFGLPERRHLNRAYAVMAVAAGLDAVIMDPLDSILQALILAAEALVNRDRYCLEYINAYNQNRLGG